MSFFFATALFEASEETRVSRSPFERDALLILHVFSEYSSSKPADYAGAECATQDCKISNNFNFKNLTI